MHILLVSTYELGHQPLHVASPAAALRAAGHDVRCLDLAVDDWDAGLFAAADKVAFSVPMHTAMRLAVSAATQLKRRRADLPVCLYGLYAAVGVDRTVGTVADRVIAGEYLDALVAWASDRRVLSDDVIQLGRRASESTLPARELLPALDRYARLAVAGEERLVGYVEASRGCSHRCRHCPVPVVYDGRIRMVGEDAVLADVAQLVDAGALHITFGDPDFLNAPQHARRTVEAVHRSFPHLTFDCTTKVEHILKYEQLWPDLATAGCLFVVSAFESVDDTILRTLDKGHTAREASQSVRLLRGHGIEIRPSWLPFTPWTTIDGVAELIDFVRAHDLVDNVDPVQYSVRLLVPDGSLLLGRPEMSPHLGTYDGDSLGWTWRPDDPRTDALQADIAELVEAHADQATTEVFEEIAALLPTPRRTPARSIGPGGERPRLTEPWFCCSEPTRAQVKAVRPA